MSLLDVSLVHAPDRNDPRHRQPVVLTPFQLFDAARDHIISDLDIHVYISIASDLKPEARGTIDVRQFATEIHRREKTVSKSIRRLVDAGFLVIEDDRRMKGGGA